MKLDSNNYYIVLGCGQRYNKGVLHTNNKEEIMSSYTAQLESRIDQLETELADLQKMLIQVGFEEGIPTLKASIKELLQEQSA